VRGSWPSTARFYLNEEKLNPYLTGGMLAPIPQYVEALITGNFTGSGEAIKAAIARNSWA